MEPLAVNGRIVIPARELSFRAVRARGPGGQNVNKVSSRVELRFDLEHTGALEPAVRSRLIGLARHRIDADGMLVIESQATRDQSRNLEDARQRLAELIRRALVVPKTRTATRPTRASKRRRLEHKRQAGAKKRERRRSPEWD